MIVGMIGAIKAGCGYVPIDISIPQDRVEAIVNKVQPEFILNTSEAILPFSDITIFDVQCIIDHEEVSEFESKMHPMISFILFLHQVRRENRRACKFHTIA